MMHVKRTNPMGDTACSYTHLCRVSSGGSMSCCMGTKHVHRVVVKKNTSTEDICATKIRETNTEKTHRVQKA